ncbi:MAG: hypothetical protein JSR85_05510 [Proteobacteria bacterium]|nr:hypothetical protein [Pseudomonadota bacterium]
MKLRIAGLLSLLTGVTFSSFPVLSHFEEDTASNLRSPYSNTKKNYSEKIERRNLKKFIDQQDYAQAFLSIKKEGNSSSNLEIIAFLLKSNKGPELKELTPANLEWVVATITSRAQRRELREFLKQQDYAEAFHSIRNTGNPSSHSEIISFLFMSNGYYNWDKLSDEIQRSVVATVAANSPLDALSLFEEDARLAYHVIKNSGREDSDTEIVKAVLQEMGYSYWDGLDFLVQKKVVDSIIDQSNKRADSLEILFTEDMDELTRTKITDAALNLSEEDLACLADAIAQNAEALFMDKMSANDHANIIVTALNLTVDEINRRAAFIGHSKNELFDEHMDPNIVAWIIQKALMDDKKTGVTSHTRNLLP